MEKKMKNETWLTLEIIGDKSQIEELISVLNRHYTVVASSPLLENDRGSGFHIFLKLFEKQKEVVAVQE